MLSNKKKFFSIIIGILLIFTFLGCEVNSEGSKNITNNITSKDTINQSKENSAINIEKNSSEEHRYVGSKKSDKFHKLDCKWAKKIKFNNTIYFQSRKDALQQGYDPCKVCHP